VLSAPSRPSIIVTRVTDLFGRANLGIVAVPPGQNPLPVGGYTVTVQLSPTPGGYFIRYEPAAAEDRALEDRLSSYRANHGGRLPTGNREQPATVSKIASRTAA